MGLFSSLYNKCRVGVGGGVCFCNVHGLMASFEVKGVVNTSLLILQTQK